MSDDPMIFGDLPAGRRVDSGDTDAPAFVLRKLQKADPELVRVLRRSIREVNSKDIEQEGRTWRDRKTGEEFRLVTSFVNAGEPEASGVVAFAVRDSLVCYFRPLDAVDDEKTVVLGSVGRRRAGWGD